MFIARLEGKLRSSICDLLSEITALNNWNSDYPLGVKKCSVRNRLKGSEVK